jgi:hypothetical protein
MATVTLKGGISLNVNDDYEEIVKEMYLKIDKTNAFIELECFYLPDVSKIACIMVSQIVMIEQI